ncbi:MAG: hypothetical protein ACKO4L_06390 [Nodosilinea sp.]
MAVWLSPTLLARYLLTAVLVLGLTLVLWMRTQPLKQYAVGREFRRRLRLALEQAHITIGIPQQNIASGPEDYGLTTDLDPGGVEE